jgi:hypothetical protein
MANLNNGSASNSAANLTVNNTNNNSLGGNSMTNSTAFTNAFDGANYSEVAPLINYGLSIVNFEGKGTSIAQFLVNGLFPIKEVSHLANDSEEQRAQTEASVKASNDIAVANQAAFINNYGPKLGYIAPTTLICSKGFGFDKANHVLKGILKSLFTVKVTARNADPKFYGLEEQVSNNVVNFSNASLVWFSVLAAATANLTISDRANFISIMFAKTCVVEGTVITRDDVAIDLAQGTIALSGRVLKVNKACNFGMENHFNSFVVLDGLHSIFMFALQALGGSAKQLTTSINLAVSLFAPEHNYGHEPNTDDMAFFVRANLIYSSAVESTHTSFPTFGIIAGKQHPNFLGWVINKGIIATSDKTNIKFVTINAGAEAVGIGFNKETGSFMTANDAGKPTKFFNRAAANNYDCADMVARQSSKFGFALSNGKVARTKGALKKVAFTNSVLGFGSGVAILNKDSRFQFSVAKKIKETVSLSLFGANFVNNPEIKQQLILSLAAKLDRIAAEQTVVKAGEIILEISCAGAEYALVKNTEAVADVVIKGGVVKTNSMNDNAVDIIVDVVINADTQFVKTRRFGTKFTTLPYEANFVGEDFSWDIILNNETVKGQGALLEMFANETGERVLNSSTGEFVSPCGDVINLLNADNKFNEWKLSSVKKDVKLQMEIAKSVWNNMSKWAVEANVIVISETATSVVVEETLDVIFGELVFDVEISTALESVSKSSFTLESAAAVYLQNARLGSILFDACKANTNRFVKLANNYSGFGRDAFTVIDVTNVDDVTAFVEVACVSNNQRDVVKALSAAYPSGVTFVFNQAKANINFELVSEFGQFGKLNGGAISDASVIYALVLSLIYGGLTTKTLSDAQKAFNKIVSTAVDSSNVLKKATRSGDLVYGKVRTSYSPLLNSEDGIPVVVMNAKCPMLKLAGIKSSGEFVGIARTPMPFLGGARVIITNDDSICDVAHVLVDPFVWASLTEGDSDGDGIAVLALNSYKVSNEEIREINNSLMGLAGYAHLYGVNVPFADFVSASDKNGKKSLREVSTMINTVMTDDEGNKVAITPAFVGDFAARVASHYKGAVGTSYGLCSQIIFAAADSVAAGKSASNRITACLIVWRLFYEGLALSGYSAKAARVMDILNLASVDIEGQQVSVSEGGTLNLGFKKGPNDVLISGAQLLAAEFPELDFDAEVFQMIIASRSITRVIPKLEGFGKMSSHWDAVRPAAIKYGALRRISQGDARVAIELGLMEEAELASRGEYVGVAAARIYAELAPEVKSSMFSNTLLGELTDAVCSFHAQIVVTNAQVLDSYQ